MLKLVDTTKIEKWIDDLDKWVDTIDKSSMSIGKKTKAKIIGRARQEAYRNVLSLIMEG